MAMWMLMRRSVENAKPRFLVEPPRVKDPTGPPGWTSQEGKASLYSTQDLRRRGLWPQGRIVVGIDNGDGSRTVTEAVEVIAVEAGSVSLEQTRKDLADEA